MKRFAILSAAMILTGCATTVAEQETVTLRYGGDSDASIVRPGLLQSPDAAVREREAASIEAHGAQIGGVMVGIETSDGRSLNFTFLQHADGALTARTQPGDTADNSICDVDIRGGPETTEIGRVIEWCRNATEAPPAKTATNRP